MALPVGVSTCEIRFGSPASGFAGEPVSVSLSVTPTATLIWESTGQPVIDFTITGAAVEGVPGTVNLPHVDQAGFRDQAGNTVTHWAYVISGSWKSGSQAKSFRRVVQPLVGQTSIDLDLVPEGAALPMVLAPTLPVTSLDGMTGALAATHLRNLGGLVGARKMTETEYAAITPADDVFYVVVAD
jgi:hypothetical protein